MNIHELDSFDLADAVKFNDELNPRIWQGSRMRPEVRRKLLAIAKDFKQSLGLTDLEVKDITVSGSNAGYTYTPHSDIDLHLVVDIPQADSSEVYRELFNAKKYQYNDEHNLSIGGYPVELYVENANEPPVSQGMFSVLANDWINIPRKRKSTVNDNAVKSKYELMKHRIETAIESEDLKRLSNTAARVKQMRQAGLAKNGELGPENLAYKILRTQGLIEKLYAARTAAKDRQLSLQERKKKKSRVRYGFGGYWAPGFGFGSEDGGDGGGGGESVGEDATISPYGVNPTTQMFLNETDDAEQTVHDFIEHAADRLGIERIPKIELHSDPDWSEREHSFGRYTPETHTLEVSLANRHVMDILRTVAHELVHCRQHEISPLPDEAGATGSRWENEAHAKAGVLMRDYADAHPNYFDSRTLEEGLIKNAGAAAALSAAMVMTPAQAQQYLPQDQQQQVQQQGQLNTLQILNIARTIHSLKNNLTRAGAEEEINQEFKNYLRATQGDPNAQNLSRLWQLQQRKQQQQQPQQPLPSNQYQREDIAEASGYIPTDAEKNDPRFVMALSPDVRPGATGKNANKMRLKTDAQGRPALLMKEFVNQLHEEFEQFDESVALFEIKMTGKNLRAEAAKTGAIAGMEFEMIVPNMERDPDDNDYDEMEPDWDYNESVNSIEDACDFFDNGENNSSGDIRRLRERMQEDYWEWQGEQFDSRWESDEEQFVYDYLKENASADEIAEILGVEPNEDGEYPDPDREAYRNASEKVVEQGYGNFWYDAARESAQEDFNQSADDESEWLEDRDINTMRDVMENFGNVDWPYYYAPSSYDNDGATIEDVANDFQDAIGVDVRSSDGYHSDSVERPSPSSHHYVVEPDGSLKGDNPGDRGLEFVSPPLPIDVILNDLNKVKRWANAYGCYTNDSTGLHINISVPNYSRENLDFVKLAILMGDEYVSESFGRLGAFYAKSAMGMIRDNIRSRPEAVEQALEKMKTHLDTAASKAIHSGVTAKYTSINVKDGHIEFRSPGGDWLDENFDKIENTLLRFTVAMSAATNPEMYREEYLKKLYKLLNPDGIKDEYGDMIQEFAKYMTSLQGDGKEASGKLSKETQQAVKDFRKVAARELQQKNLSNKLKKGDTGGQRYWWNVSWGNGRIEVVASTKEEAIDTAFKESYWAPDEPDTPQAIQFRGSLRAKPLRPFEENPKQSKPFVWKVYGSNSSPYQRLGIEVVASNELEAMKKARKQWDLNVGGRTEEEFFSTNGWSAVRVREAPAEQTPNYQIYNRQTNVALPGEEFWAKDDDDALTRLADYQLHGPHSLQPGQADRMFGVRTSNGVEVVGLDIPMVAPRAQTSTPDQQQGGLVDVAGSTNDLARQRATPGTFTGAWRVLDTDGNELYRFSGIGNNQSDANRVAVQWMRDNGYEHGTDMTVVPVMSEGIAESMPQPSQGQGKYRDLNKPLGPETPPQMPAGTTKIDVSDTQDWYQMGMDISNISAAKPEEYNQGPPHTVIVFPSDEFEQPYLKQFKRLGLKTHDIDPPGEEDIDEDVKFFSMPLRMSEYRGKHHPATKQPYDAKFKFSGDLKDRVHGLLDAGTKPMLMQVNPRHLLATQDWLSSQGGGKPPFATMKQHPVVLQKNNKLYILDGHHRSADALKSGTPIEVYLFKDEL